ncbi:MAG: ankyrin repeat domain-containing protein [Betaproteobacteria bacterium]|nr:ankyrin repeat domain-containing protein [Betaproteobacteria bacterium]
MTAKGFTSNNLLDAIRAGSLSGVISALDNGDDIELPDMHGCRGLPLRTACFEGNLAIVRELLNHGANPNAVASDGAGAPLRLALRKGHQNIVDLLLENGATPNAGTATPPESLEGPGPALARRSHRYAIAGTRSGQYHRIFVLQPAAPE